MVDCLLLQLEHLFHILKFCNNDKMNFNIVLRCYCWMSTLVIKRRGLLSIWDTRIHYAYLPYAFSTFLLLHVFTSYVSLSIQICTEILLLTLRNHLLFEIAFPWICPNLGFKSNMMFAKIVKGLPIPKQITTSTK